MSNKSQLTNDAHTALMADVAMELATDADRKWPLQFDARLRKFREHVNHCLACADTNKPPCDEARELWREYEVAKLTSDTCISHD